MTDPTFDGPSKRIVIPATTPISAQNVYSAWKRWVLVGNAEWVEAFRPVAGDPISPTQNVAPYFFLNTSAGWRIQPFEANHELRVAGNLYSEDPDLSMFAPTLGAYTVTVVVERSASSIEVLTGGGSVPTADQVAEAVWQKSIPSDYAAGSAGQKLGALPSANDIATIVSGSGLTPAQATMLLELYRLGGLDPTRPLVVSSTRRRVPESGSDIDQRILDNGGVITVERQ